MLFKFNKKGNVIIEPEAIKLTKHLKKLDEKQLLFVILFCDYSSKYHQLPTEERLFVCKKEVYEDSGNSVDQEKVVKEAIEEYTSLQFDSKRETLRIYKDKIASLANDLLNEANLDKMVKIDKAIKTLTSRLDEIQKEIDSNDSEIITSTGDKLSMIEKWQLNRLEYNRAKKKKEEISGIEIIE